MRDGHLRRSGFPLRPDLHAYCLMALNHRGLVRKPRIHFEATSPVRRAYRDITIGGKRTCVENQSHATPAVCSRNPKVCCDGGTFCMTNDTLTWPFRTFVPPFKIVPEPAKPDRLKVD